jgi:hypothetical protein
MTGRRTQGAKDFKDYQGCAEDRRRPAEGCLLVAAMYGGFSERRRWASQHEVRQASWRFSKGVFAGEAAAAPCTP